MLKRQRSFFLPLHLTGIEAYFHYRIKHLKKGHCYFFSQSWLFYSWGHIISQLYFFLRNSDLICNLSIFHKSVFIYFFWILSLSKLWLFLQFWVHLAILTFFRIQILYLAILLIFSQIWVYISQFILFYNCVFISRHFFSAIVSLYHATLTFFGILTFF